MAGYYDDDEYGPGPYRPGAAQFDTMNLGPGPQRAEQFNTANLGPAPHRVPQFDTMNLEVPVRAQEPKAEKPTGGNGRNAAYHTDPAPLSGGYMGGGTGQTPMNPALETQSTVGGGRLMRTGLVITSLCLRAAAAVSLIVGLAILASDSQTIDVAITDLSTVALTWTFSAFSSTKYALAVAIIGAVYSIYETVSAAVRLAMRHPMLPGNISLFISYIGDQVVVVLLLSGASAAAATLTDLHQPNIDGVTYCDYISKWCNQAGGGVAMIFLGFCFLAANLVISSFCFYTGRS